MERTQKEVMSTHAVNDEQERLLDCCIAIGVKPLGITQGHKWGRPTTDILFTKDTRQPKQYVDTLKGLLPDYEIEHFILDRTECLWVSFQKRGDRCEQSEIAPK